MILQEQRPEMREKIVTKFIKVMRVSCHFVVGKKCESNIHVIQIVMLNVVLQLLTLTPLLRMNVMS